MDIKKDGTIIPSFIVNYKELFFWHHYNLHHITSIYNLFHSVLDRFRCNRIDCRFVIFNLIDSIFVVKFQGA